MSRVEGCPVCQSSDVREFLRRDSVPVGQNLLMPDRHSALGVARGGLHLCVCCGCGFVFNSAFEPEKAAYGGSYDNNQNCSPAFAEHVSGLVHHLVEDRGARGVRVVEVGCGDGSFLKRLVGADRGNTGVGFDLSYRGPSEDLDGRARFIREQFGTESVSGAADVVVCRHVIEHVPDPVALLRSVARAAPGARAFFETPDVEWIVRRRAVWDLFYEHCSYFSAGSLATAFEAAGFRVVEVRRVFRGQYLWAEAEAAPDAGRRPPPARRAGSLPALAEQFGKSEGLLVGCWRSEVARLAATGDVALWGAGAKGVTFANLVDPDRQLIDCVVDIYSVKQGKYVPGTGHPIVSPTYLAGQGRWAVLLMNPNYYDEVAAVLAASQIEAKLINLTEWAVEDTH
jgi:SAM-dependent methyltransferase